MRKITTAFTSALFAISLTACASTNDNLITDGPRAYNFNSDLAACEGLSYERQPNHLKTAGGAILGGLVGAGEADKGDEGKGALIGAAIGGVIGSAKAKIDVQKERRQIVEKCMTQRGHRIVG